MELPEHPETVSDRPWRHRLSIYGAKALVVAVIAVILVRGFSPQLLFLCGFPPLMAAGYLERLATRWEQWIAWSFLCLIGLGAIVSQFPGVFPNMRGFDRELDPKHDRMMIWYCTVYLLFLTVVVPWFIFGKALRRGWRGKLAEWSPVTCYLGLVTSTLLAIAGLAYLASPTCIFRPVFE